MSKLKVGEEHLIAWVEKAVANIEHFLQNEGLKVENALETEGAKIAPALILILNNLEKGLDNKVLTVLVDAFDTAEKTNLPAEFIAILKNQLLNAMKFALALQVVFDPNATEGDIEASIKAIVDAYHLPYTQKDQFLTTVGAMLIKQWQAFKNSPDSTFAKAAIILEATFKKAEEDLNPQAAVE